LFDFLVENARRIVSIRIGILQGQRKTVCYGGINDLKFSGIIFIDKSEGCKKAKSCLGYHPKETA